MTTDKIWVRILICNDCGTEKFLNVFFPVVYDKRDEFGFPIVNFPWLNGDVPRLPSCGIYISQNFG